MTQTPMEMKAQTSAMLDAVLRAIGNSDGSACCIYRDGERVVTVWFTGDSYDVHVLGRPSHPRYVSSVAKRLIREGYKPEEVEPLTITLVAMEKQRPTRDEVADVANTYLRNLGVVSLIGTCRYEGTEAVLTCLDDLNEKMAVLRLARLKGKGVVVVGYKPIPHRCSFCGEPLSHEEIQREAIRHDACDELRAKAHDQADDQMYAAIERAITQTYEYPSLRIPDDDMPYDRPVRPSDNDTDDGNYD